MSISEKFLDSMLNVSNRGPKFEQTNEVFSTLCAKHMVLEKLRADLVLRNLCPVTLHSLCSVFAMAYCLMMPMCGRLC